MSNVFHVDKYVNLNHVDNDQFDSWIDKSGAKEEFEQVIDLATNNASPRDIQKALLDLEDKTLDSMIDIPGVYQFPKDLRIEVVTDKEHLTLGWHDNGGNANCYVSSEKHRH